MIDQFPLLLPDPARAGRTRARCHQRLVRQTRPRTQRRLIVERAIVLGLGVVYLSSIALDVMRVLIR